MPVPVMSLGCVAAKPEPVHDIRCRFSVGPDGVTTVATHNRLRDEPEAVSTAWPETWSFGATP